MKLLLIAIVATVGLVQALPYSSVYLKQQNTEDLAVGNIFDNIKQLYEDLKELFDTKFKPLLDWVISHIKEIAPYLNDPQALVKKLAQMFIDDVKNLNEEIAKEAKEFFGNYQKILGELWQKVLDAIHKFFPNLVTDEELRAAATQTKQQDFDNLALRNIFDDIKKLYDNLKELFDTKFKPLLDWVISHIKEIAPYLNDPPALIKKLAQMFLDDIKNLNEELAKEAKEFFANYQKILGELWQKVLNAIHKFFPNLVTDEELRAAGSQKFGLKHNEVELLIPSNVGNIIDDLKELYKDFKELFTAHFKPLLDWFISNFKELEPYLQDAKTLLEMAAKQFIDKIEEIDEPLAKLAKEFFGAFKEELGDLWKQFEDAIHKKFPDL